MGLRLSDLPTIGQLSLTDRRALARWLRDTIPRGTTLAEEPLTIALRASSFGVDASVGRLVEVEWLQRTGDALSADTYTRRFAAAAVGGERMSVAYAHELALQVRERVALRGGTMGGVTLNQVVLYGSSLRDEGNVHPDVGDLDLAVQMTIVSPALRAAVDEYPPAQRWRAAMRLSGWEHTLMAGDDRITVAGPLATVLFKVNQQLHGLPEALATEADRRAPVLAALWGPVPAIGRQVVIPCGEPIGDLDMLSDELWKTLSYATEWTLRTQERARALNQALAARKQVLGGQ